MTYILPTDDYNASGGQPAHIDAQGWPLCGARMPATYIIDTYLMAWNLCETCRHIADAGLFSTEDDEQEYNGVAVA